MPEVNLGPHVVEQSRSCSQKPLLMPSYVWKKRFGRFSNFQHAAAVTVTLLASIHVHTDGAVSRPTRLPSVQMLSVRLLHVFGNYQFDYFLLIEFVLKEKKLKYIECGFL
jgi:hypothetical protein